MALTRSTEKRPIAWRPATTSATTGTTVSSQAGRTDGNLAGPRRGGGALSGDQATEIDRGDRAGEASTDAGRAEHADRLAGAVQPGDRLPVVVEEVTLGVDGE